MFKIQGTKEDSNGVSFFLDYTIKGEIKSIEVTAASAKTANIRYCQLAFDFLQFSIDELYCEIQKIRPHYFNSALVPYINDLNWCCVYWNLLTMRESIALMKDSPKRYATRVAVTDLTALIPLFQFENRETISSLVNDIKQVSIKMTEFIKKIESYETSVSVC